MRNDNQKAGVILAACGILPVVWIALLTAPFVGGGLVEVIRNFPIAMQRPFSITVCEDSVKTVLIFLLAYAMGIGIYFSTRRNYRRREEHGSAKWGDAKTLNKKYADKNFSANKLLTQTVRIGLDGKKHRRNLNVLVCGGSGAGKTRFYCKINAMQCDAETSMVILDPKGEIVRDVGGLLEKKGYEVRVLDLINMHRRKDAGAGYVCLLPFPFPHSGGGYFIETQKKYGIIYADPPWRYQQKNLSGAAEHHYSTMSVEEICQLDVASVAADDCVLFLWATFPQLQEALQVIKAWDFQYKTVAFVWLKQNKSGKGWFFGLGFWTRGNAELCLLATRGKPHRKSNRVHQFIISPLRQHSQKPSEAREKIVELMGELPRLELFAREKADGWDTWGNEVACDVEINSRPETTGGGLCV